ncbi:hypothetical protein AALB39_10670 [Lachnospiraceae bacterium 54-53]
MKKVQTKKSLLQEVNTRYHMELKHLKRKRFCLKLKLMLTIVLPIIILVLFVTVIRTYVRIRLRNLFTRPFNGSVSSEPARPVPLKTAPVEKEGLPPEPVSEDE